MHLLDLCVCIPKTVCFRAVKEFKAGKRILPLSTQSTEAKQARLSNIVSEIIVIDREAPVTARNYSNRNPPVPRSLSGTSLRLPC